MKKKMKNKIIIKIINLNKLFPLKLPARKNILKMR